MPETFSASRAARMMTCHASANLDLAIEGWQPPVQDPTANNAANRGTHMHEMMAELMTLTSGNVQKFSEALMYIAELRQRRRFNVLIEESVKCGWLPSNPGTTADLVLYVSDEIHIVDLKTGKIPVLAYDNKQLLFYAASYGLLAPKAKGVHLHIVQPWAGVMQDWYADTSKIKQFMDDAIAADIAITAGSTQCTPSDTCMFCPANPQGRGQKGKPFCPVMLQLLYPSIPLDENAILKEE